MSAIGHGVGPLRTPGGAAALQVRLNRLKGSDTERLAKVLAREAQGSAGTLIGNLVPAAPPVEGEAGSTDVADAVSVRGFMRRLEAMSDSDIKRLAVAVGNLLYASGEGAKGKAGDKTNAFLREIAGRHANVDDLSVEQRLELAAEVMAFAISPAARSTKPTEAQANIDALNGLYLELLPSVEAARASVLDSVSPKVMDLLSSHGIVSKAELRAASKSASKDVKALVKAGLASVEGDWVAFARPEAVNLNGLKSRFTAEQLSHLGRAVLANLGAWKAGLALPGEPTDRPLFDEARIQRIANETGLSPAEVAVFIKAREAQGALQRNDEGGLVVSARAAVHGLGIRSERMAKVAELEARSRAETRAKGILDASAEARSSKDIPRLNYPTESGGLPKIFFMDELLLGLEWLDADMVRRSLAEFKACPDPDKLMVLPNPIMGETGRRTKKSARNLVPGFERLGAQVAELHRLVEMAEAKPLVLMGGKDRTTLDFMTAQQFLREMKIDRELRKAQRSANPSLKSSETALQRLDRQSYERLREKDPDRWQSIENMMKDVALPYVYKMGRELFDAPEVFEQSGFRMTEFEILKDCTMHLRAAQAARAQGRPESEANALEAEVRALYAGIVDFEVLEAIVAKPEDALVTGATPVVRDSVELQFQRPDGRNGLTMWAFADFVSNPDTQYGATTLLESVNHYIKSRKAGGESAPDLVVAGGQGRTVFLYHDDTIVLGLPSTQGLNGTVPSRYAIDAPGKMKRRVFNRRGNPMSGQIRIKGGMAPDGVKTGAYEIEFTNPKIQKVIARNVAEGREPDEVKMLLISDFQTGSPTMRPAEGLRMLDKALAEGVDHIFLDGDLIQGWNYRNFAEESQETGLIHPMTQVDFIAELFSQVIGGHVASLRQAHPDLDDHEIAAMLPTITICDGNHEWNTGDRYHSGEQLASVRDRIAGAYPLSLRKDKVRYITQFENHNDDHVDFSSVQFYDIQDRTGIGVLGQHLYGGSKGSKLTSPAESHATWARAKGIEMQDIHFTLGGHFHTSTIVESDGMFHVIAGAMAGQSGFEQMLGYSDGEPASGIFTFSSHQNPTMKLVTKRLVEHEEQARMDAGEPVGLTAGMQEIIQNYGSVEAYIEAARLQFAKRADRTQRIPEGRLTAAAKRRRAQLDPS